MKDFVYYNELFDCYGNLLTEKEQECFKEYYTEDLSYGEIASYKNISRSAVQKTIKIVLSKLEEYESKLKILKHKKEITKILELNNLEQIKKELERILN